MTWRMFFLICLIVLATPALAGDYPVVDTGLEACFDDTRQIDCPRPGEPFSGQDGQYRGNPPQYRDNGDGTVSDLVTGLMWVRERGEPLGWQQAMDRAASCRVGGYGDWRAPTIKELYSLIDFNGRVGRDAGDSVPYLDTRFFGFAYGDPSAGQRIIDCQDWSSTVYRGTTMGGNHTVFGVNFADGRIKGYPAADPARRAPSRYMRYVRGNPAYGRNDFRDNGDDTVADRATGLVWQQSDDGRPRDWEHALAYCESLDLGGRTDWRLPSAKELQTLVDYGRSPTATNSPAIDPVFRTTRTESYFWSSTTHLDGGRPDRAAYVAFGRAMGYFAPPGSNRAKALMDVHGAGAQRSDPKSGDPARWAGGHGPQGDDVRILNSVRCVAGGGVAWYEPANERITLPTRGPGTGNTSSALPGGRDRTGDEPPARRTPPPEALAACKAKSPGQSCTMQTPRGTLPGLCRETPDGTVCVPERR